MMCLILILLTNLNLWDGHEIYVCFEKAINQNLFRMMVHNKNALAQGISIFNKNKWRSF